jgi:hypothetical protein
LREAILILRHCPFTYRRRADASQSIWGKTKFEIMQQCRRNQKLLPSSTFCKGSGINGWTNMFRIEEDFEIKTGKS